MFCCSGPKDSVEVEDVILCQEIRARTANDESVPADQALQMLKDGNRRFVNDMGEVAGTSKDDRSKLRESLSTHGQNPAAIVIGCADSRCPIEVLFDAQPGDLFVLRNAGNTCTHAEGSIVGSAEYAVGHLGTNLILVLGHTKCGAIAGATATMMAAKAPKEDEPKQGDRTRRPSLLDTMLTGLAPVAEHAVGELPEGSGTDEVAAHAVKVNVLHTMDKLLEYSKPLRTKVEEGKVQVHGAIYDLESGLVNFLGKPASLKQDDEHPAFRAD